MYARLALGLGAFLVTVGVIYGVTGHEYTGMLLLIVASACIAFIGLYVRRVVQEAARETESGHAEAEVEEPHVGPTIWPFVLPLGALGLVLGHRDLQLVVDTCRQAAGPERVPLADLEEVGAGLSEREAEVVVEQIR